MSVCSSWFPHKKIHKVTWNSPDGKTSNQIDHVIVDGRYASHILDVRSKRGANIDSDHHLVAVKVRVKIVTDRKKMESGNDVERWQYEKLKNKDIQAEFESKVEVKLNSPEWQDENGVDNLWCVFKNTIQDVAKEVLGEEDKPIRNQWFDQECAELIRKKNEARLKMLSNNTRSRAEDYRKMRGKCKKVFRQKKRKIISEELKEMENARLNKISRKFFEKIRNTRQEYKPQCKFVRTKEGELITDQARIIERWAEYYEEKFKHDTFHEGTDSGLVDVNKPNTFTMTPNIEDLRKAISALKNNKAPGIDAIANEMIKNCGKTGIVILHKIIKNVWIGETDMPQDWNTGLINPIPKKGDSTHCNNYRAITLLNTAYKITTSIIRTKLEEFYENTVGNYQCGFRKNKSTTNQLFSIRQMLEKLWERNVTSYHLFIDFTTAYDSVVREELWTALEELEVPKELVYVCKVVTMNSQARVKMGRKLSRAFSTDKGVKQGDGLAPMLFNLALEAVIRRSNIRRSGTLFHQSCQILGYADDIDIAGRSIKAVKEAFQSIEHEAARLGLKVNESKTKFMVVTRNEETLNRAGPRIEMGNYNFEVVKEFTYLGSVLTTNNDESEEIKRRIIKANKAYFSLTSQMRSQDVTRTSKAIMYKTLIRPILTYGAECWTLKDSDGDKIARFERKVLRRIYGATKLGTNEYRKKTNEELYELYEDSDVVSFVKINRLRWLGHINRMEDVDPCKKLLLGNIDNKRPRGRPRNRWWDAVNKDIKALGIENWRMRSRNRNQWRQILLEAKDLLRTVTP